MSTVVFRFIDTNKSHFDKILYTSQKCFLSYGVSVTFRLICIKISIAISRFTYNDISQIDI